MYAAKTPYCDYRGLCNELVAAAADNVQWPVTFRQRMWRFWVIVIGEEWTSACQRNVVGHNDTCALNDWLYTEMTRFFDCKCLPDRCVFLRLSCRGTFRYLCFIPLATRTTSLRRICHALSHIIHRIPAIHANEVNSAIVTDTLDIFATFHVFYVLSVFYPHPACHNAVSHCLIKRVLLTYLLAHVYHLSLRFKHLL